MINLKEVDSALAAKLTGVSLRQLNHWDSLGIVSPSIGPAQGSGSRRRFAPDDLLLLAAANALRRAGAALEAIRTAASAIRAASIGLDCSASLIVVLGSDQVRYVGELEQWLGAGSHDDECLTVLNLGRVAAHVREVLSHETPTQVRRLQIGSNTYHVTIEPAPGGVGFQALLKARQPLIATGPTIEAVLEALRRAAESDAQASADTSSRGRSKASGKPDGASAWGGGW